MGKHNGTGRVPQQQQPPPAHSGPVGSGGYNAGTDDDRRAALNVICDYVKTLITIATGSVALSATFLASLYHGHALSQLVWAWGLLGGSVVVGLLVIGTVIEQFAQGDLRPRRSGAEYLALFQLLLTLAGLALFAWFAVRNVSG